MKKYLQDNVLSPLLLSEPFEGRDYPLFYSMFPVLSVVLEISFISILMLPLKNYIIIHGTSYKIQKMLGESDTGREGGRPEIELCTF